MPNFRWHFSEVTDGSHNGWNDSSIAHFRLNPLQNLAREIIQNSMGASQSEKAPVEVVFNSHFVDKKSIPDVNSLEERLRYCLEHAERSGEETAESIKEIRAAARALEDDKIHVLSISDSGTSGMHGPCELGYPFYRYMKSEGQSGGPSDRGGSHGIGKAAPLCVSKIRTIFASTQWEGDNGKNSLVQGRTTLMTHKIGESLYWKVGYWGTEDYLPVKNESCPAPHDWIAHKGGIGTTIHVLSWHHSSDWRDSILGYAASNFFAAFMRNRLRVTVRDNKGENILDSSTIKTVLSNQRIAALMKSQNSGHSFAAANLYHECLSGGQGVKVFELQLTALGHCKLYLMLKDDAPQKIALIRKDMMITDQIPGFWTSRSRDREDFAGVIEFESVQGRELIRSMENPCHNELSPDWLSVDERQAGRNALRQLADRLKEKVREVMPVSGEGDSIDFLKKFFADEAEDGEVEEDLEKELNPNGKFVISERPIQLPLPPSAGYSDESELAGEDLEDDGLGDEGGAGNGGGNGDEDPYGPGEGDGTGGTGTKSKSKAPKSLALRDVRIVKMSARSARIFATSDSNADAKITLQEVGADSDDGLSIQTTSRGEGLDGGIRVALQASKRLDVKVTLDRDVVGGLKILAVKMAEQEE